MSFGDTGARMPLESADVDGRIVDAAERQRVAKREAVEPADVVRQHGGAHAS